MPAFAQHPGLDPFATGDHDTRCWFCQESNLDNPTTREETPCPRRRAGREACAACCVQMFEAADDEFAYDCADCQSELTKPSAHPADEQPGEGRTPIPVPRPALPTPSEAA